jgi:hypothetical protein
MDGQRVDLYQLPSRGLSYPQDIEIYVKPLSIKEQIDMERYGISDAEYFNILLGGITIHGNFNKRNLLHSDVQFLDVVRRLFSFDTKDVITIQGCQCVYNNCRHEFDYEFTMDQLDFTEFNEDIFGKHFIFSEGTDDELEVVVSPITVDEYIKMSREFRNHSNKKNALSSMYTDYLCGCIREVEGRTFKDLRDRNSFLKGYIENLCMAKDKKLLKQIIDETIIKIKPFTLLCESCGRETEVEVMPTSNFQQ